MYLFLTDSIPKRICIIMQPLYLHYCIVEEFYSITEN